MEIRVSVLIPAYNEEENIPHLVSEIDDFVRRNNLTDWEFILIDDGSKDGTYNRFQDLAKGKTYLRGVRYARNQGVAKALRVGVKNARGNVVVVFAADLQFLLDDAKNLVDKLNEGFDLVTGKKVGKYEKKFVSRVYNFLSRMLFGVPVTDMNSIKALKKEILEEMPLRKDWHRYIVAFAWEMGYSVTEIPVTLRPRLYGESKYRGLKRVIIGLLDLIAVKFQLSLMKKPMLFFGTLGLVSLFLGFITGIIAFIMRYGFHHGNRALLFLVILLILSGLVLFAMGFMGEFIAVILDRLNKIEENVKENLKK
ncbi:MAG: glycosyltransferase [candidate division WOR-3 bacterium]